jgi:glycerol kinase
MPDEIDAATSEVVIAIDAGTTGVRSVAFDSAARQVLSAYRELTQHFPAPGLVEHDPAEIWTLVEETLSEVAAGLAAEGRAVRAIGITNQRETAIAFDRATGTPIGRAIVWQDRRTAGRCDALRRAGRLPLIRGRTGLVLDPYFSATKWEYMLANYGQMPQELGLCTVDTWVVWNLTGGKAYVTDGTNASRTLCFDIRERTWSHELSALFGVPIGTLPQVVPSCGRVGIVADEVAAGALAGVPVSGIAGDQQAALFGQACTVPGEVKVTFGTGTFTLMNVGREPPAAAEGLLTTVAWDLGTAVPEGQAVAYALEGAVFVSGAAIQWLRDGLGIIERADQTEALAASIPDTEGVYLVPAFVGLGSPWWDPEARGTVVGLTRGAGRAHLARAVVEAIAYQTRDVVDAMTRATGTSLAGLFADGGASAMDLLLQLTADQVRARVSRRTSAEITALGAALLAGLAEEMWTSLDQLRGLVETAATFEPLAAPAKADAGYAGWTSAVARSRAWSAPPEEGDPRPLPLDEEAAAPA